MSKVKVTWQDGTSQIFNDIPADIDEAKARAALEEKFKKKIKTYTRVESNPTSQTDRDSSSQTPPVDDKSPTVLSTLPSGQRDDEKDYRANFPDKHTPKNMRRNKWGELIYE
jgi:hypothetical protein